MKILVVGGGGFLGRHLIASLRTEGHSVTCLDNFVTGLEDFPPSAGGALRVVRHDVCKPFPFDPVHNDDDRFQQIYQLACPASPSHYQIDPIRTATTCFLGTLHALELCWAIGPSCRILLTSSSEVYGDPEAHPQPETYRGNVSCTGPRACYDEGKRIAETLMFDAHRCHGTQVRVARIFNAYGPGMRKDDGRIIPQFATQALRSEDITVYGDGTQTRCFCFVEDIVDGLQRLMNHCEPGDGALTGPVNIGSPVESTVLEIAHTILQLVPGSTSKIVFRPLPVDDPRQRRPDIGKARNLLGWEPRTTLLHGLEQTLAFFSRCMSS